MTSGSLELMPQARDTPLFSKQPQVTFGLLVSYCVFCDILLCSGAFPVKVDMEIEAVLEVARQFFEVAHLTQTEPKKLEHHNPDVHKYQNLI